MGCDTQFYKSVQTPNIPKRQFSQDSSYTVWKNSATVTANLRFSNITKNNFKNVYLLPTHT